MSRTQAIDMAASYFDSGRFLQVLQQRVAIRSESQKSNSGPVLRSYLIDSIVPQLGLLGFTWKIIDNRSLVEAHF